MIRRSVLAVGVLLACDGSKRPAATPPSAPSTTTPPSVAASQTTARPPVSGSALGSASTPAPPASTAPAPDRPDAAAVAAVAPPPVEPEDKPADCSKPFPSDAELRGAKPGTATTIKELFEKKPRVGRFSVEGYAQAHHHCPSCPPGASCKPCEETIFLSDAVSAYKDPIADGVDLRIHVPDARVFDSRGRYRMTIVLCGGSSNRDRLPERALRGYQKL